MIRNKIDELLKKYFVNYDPRNLKLGLFKGKIQIENLYFNTKQFNAQMEEANIPIKVKFGIISKLTLDVSFLNLQLDLLEIKDFILVVSPEPTYASPRKPDYREDTEELSNAIFHVIENFERQAQGHAMTRLGGAKDPGEIHKKNMESLKSALKSANARIQRSGDGKGSQGGLNIFGPELNELLLGRMNFKILIRNFRVYYEYDAMMKLGFQQDYSFGLCFSIKDFKFRSVSSDSSLLFHHPYLSKFFNLSEFYC